MAKRQSRRTFSVNGAIHAAVIEAAAASGVTASEWLTQLIRNAIPELPVGRHLNPSTRMYRGGPAPTRRDVIERSIEIRQQQVAIAEATRPAPATDAEIYAAWMRRRSAGLLPGQLCAVCVESKATHRAAIDKGGPVYALCDGCAPEAKSA